MAKWRRSEWKWAKEWNERDHKSCLSALIMRGQAKISFAHARGVSGACPVRLFEKLEKVFLAKLGHQSRKRAERGWKSEAGPLSWKSGWKPSISRWFWAIGSYCIFFPFRDMAILKCPLGRIKFPMLKYGPVECLIWGMFQWAKQAFIGTVPGNINILVAAPHREMQIRFVSSANKIFLVQPRVQRTHFIAELQCNYRKIQCTGMYCKNDGNARSRKEDRGGETVAVSK